MTERCTGAGPSPHEMSPAQLEQVNQRWDTFFREKQGLLRYFAQGDQDLVSMALFSVRRTLCQHPDCPASWLVARARWDILKRKHHQPGHSLDLSKSEGTRQYPMLRSRQCSQQVGMREERELFDHLQFHEYWNALTVTERALVTLLQEERGETGSRWLGSEYVPVLRHKGRARQRFREEVNPSDWEYKKAYAQIRTKFFHFFGEEWEQEREWEWLENWHPSQSLHACRNGKCQRRGQPA